jgi:hypothetical protein
MWNLETKKWSKQGCQPTQGMLAELQTTATTTAARRRRTTTTTSSTSLV